ncbi:MAG: PilN domain-containing protein, partial [Ideonella sp.]|nr:PilN domain-containing protein [Ideonella sp.]
VTYCSSVAGVIDTKEQQLFAQHRAKLMTLQEQVAAQRQEVDIEAAKLRQVEQALARVKATLQGGAAGDAAVSYAAYFEALAKQSHNALWLTGFAISPDGQSIELKGRMLEASALPDYLSRLHAEPIFKGRQFAQLQLSTLAAEGAESGPKVTEFVLRTASGQDSKEPAR